MKEFRAFPKIPRLRREWIITEKIDGTNGCIDIEPSYKTDDDSTIVATVEGPHSRDNPLGTVYDVRAGSRTRWLAPGKDDNFGFAAWVRDNAQQLAEQLGPGTHYGECYGRGIQRDYGLDQRRFALFNVERWREARDTGALTVCDVVPVIWRGQLRGDYADMVERSLDELRNFGSKIVPGYMNPEGVVAYHSGNHLFKATLEADDDPKSLHGVKKERKPRPPRDANVGGRRKAFDPGYIGPERRLALLQVEPAL